MRQQDDTAHQQLCSDLDALTRFCQPERATGTVWPSSELLQSLENSVKLLTAEERKAPLSWRAFQRLDKRKPRLRLVLRLDNLVKRARGRFEEAGQPLLSKLKRQADRGDKDARKLLRDIAAISGGQAAPKKIGWTQHERTLGQFSRTRSVEPSYGRSAPLEYRCYARALELLVDDYRREALRRRSMPLLEWVATIGHPSAKNLVAFDYATECEIERKARASQEERTLRKREKGRGRTRRHREWYRGRWIYPGDWLRFNNATDFVKFYGRKHPLPKVCAGLEDSPCRAGLEAVLDHLSCGRSLADEPYWYYQRTRHIAHCPDCQHAEWLEDGYEVEYGYPTTWWGPGDTREQRIAARKRHHQEEMQRDQRWLQTPEGRQWMRESNRRFVASLKEKAQQEGWTQEQLRAEAKAYGLIR
jgi:hypothetical protein